MIIGVPKEVKNHEYRVGMVPASVGELARRGHQVIVETGAGVGIGASDASYEKRGATIAQNAHEVFKKADMIVKVKEPQPGEYNLIREGQTLFTYLHLAPDPQQALALKNSGCIGIAYETITDMSGRLPLLTPMSEVAGRLSVQAGSHCLEKAQGGRGVLLSGVPGVSRGHVVVIGGGVVGINAIRMALGKEARVTVLERDLDRMRYLDEEFGSNLNTIYSTEEVLTELLGDADMVIGAVLVPGAAAPKLVTREMLKNNEAWFGCVDVAIDQGGCFETSRATTHDEPTFVEEGIVHYCVANMPSAVARTSAFALNNATFAIHYSVGRERCWTSIER